MNNVNVAVIAKVRNIELQTIGFLVRIPQRTNTKQNNPSNNRQFHLSSQLPRSMLENDNADPHPH